MGVDGPRYGGVAVWSTPPQPAWQPALIDHGQPCPDSGDANEQPKRFGLPAHVAV